MRFVLARQRICAAVVLTVFGVFALPQAVQAQQTLAYSGEALVVGVRALGINVSLEDTGPLPSTGGSLAAQLASASIPPLLAADLLTAGVTGQNNQTSSQASVATLSLSVAGVSIQASILTSNAEAACYPDRAAVSGSSSIAALSVNGESIHVTGAPNQTIPLLLGSLVINEQISSVTNTPFATSAAMLVNALHLKLAGIADAVVSSAYSGVTCSTSQVLPE